MWPKSVSHENSRVLIGGKDCKQKYSACLLNVSGMSFGALSKNAVLALNAAARMGDFYQNTGEGSISKFHLEHGGDIVWNIGTGYFGCRDEKGRFSEEKFKQTAMIPEVKMIEIKLFQGAKPAHGGLLPKSKLTPEIAEARGVPMDQDCVSPSSHSAFGSPSEFVDFIAHLRELSGGKPVGFKLCVGRPEEFASIVQAMLGKNIFPDFITVDGGEGGTGAAPQEFSNHIGMPLGEGLPFVDRLLTAAAIRDQIKIIASGKVLSGFTVVRTLALGADLCNSARVMMFALGCIQALKCNTNHCPTGIATQDPELMRGLVVEDKATRVFNYHKKTVESALDLIGAVGLDNPSLLRPEHIMKRTSSTEVMSYAQLFPQVDPGCVFVQKAPPQLQQAWDKGRMINAF
jgi:glutamate synthase domain-containing protein 2